MVVRQYDVYIVGLDPTLGAEIQKTRPCVVVSPDEMNQHLRTVQIAPLTSNVTPYPWRVPVTFKRKQGMVAVDQLRTVDKTRLLHRAGHLVPPAVRGIKAVIREMLVD